MGYEPFQYVLTPRYKGLTCLARHVAERGEIMSITMAFVKDGKLLDERLHSPDRVVPDLYTLFDGWGGSPLSVYVYARHLDNFNDKSPEEVRSALFTIRHPPPPAIALKTCARLQEGS